MFLDRLIFWNLCPMYTFLNLFNMFIRFEIWVPCIDFKIMSYVSTDGEMNLLSLAPLFVVSQC